MLKSSKSYNSCGEIVSQSFHQHLLSLTSQSQEQHIILYDATIKYLMGCRHIMGGSCHVLLVLTSCCVCPHTGGNSLELIKYSGQRLMTDLTVRQQLFLFLSFGPLECLFLKQFKRHKLWNELSTLIVVTKPFPPTRRN